MSNGTRSRLGSEPFVAAYLAACLLLSAGLAVSAWMGTFDWLVRPRLAGQLRLLVYVAAGGGLGAAVYCARGLYKHHSRGDYQARFVYWYLFRPWLGTVLGVMSYLFVGGGLLALGNGAPAEAFSARALLVSVAFLAGFSANEFIAKLNAVAKSLFGMGSPGNSSPAQGPPPGAQPGHGSSAGTAP